MCETFLTLLRRGVTKEAFRLSFLVLLALLLLPLDNGPRDPYVPGLNLCKVLPIRTVALRWLRVHCLMPVLGSLVSQTARYSSFLALRLLLIAVE